MNRQKSEIETLVEEEIKKDQEELAEWCHFMVVAQCNDQLTRVEE